MQRSTQYELKTPKDIPDTIPSNFTNTPRQSAKMQKDDNISEIIFHSQSISHFPNTTYLYKKDLIF